MRRRFSRLSCSVLFLLGFLWPADASASVDAIRFGIRGDKNRIVVEMGEQSDYRVFLLENPYRLVVDLPTLDWQVKKSNATSWGKLITRFRHGTITGGLTRIIFDASQPLSITDVFILPEKGSAKLVIDYQTVPRSLFSSARLKTFGNPALSAVSQLKAKGAAFSPAVYSRAPAAAPLKKPAVRQDTALQKPHAPPEKQQAPLGSKKHYVIVIDPGHGGGDPGAVGSHGVFEKSITLATARQIKTQLENTGRYKVFLTRETDKYIKLRDRVKFARDRHADLFVSIHADKIARLNVRGASVYTLSENASDVESEKLADGENTSGLIAGVDMSGEDEDVADILIDLAMREQMTESKMFANMALASFDGHDVRVLEHSNRSAGFAVLKAPDIPSVLIELGFISNPAEEKLLATSDFQSRVAQALLSGIDSYFRKIKSLQGT